MQTMKHQMQKVEEEVVVKAEEAPVSFKGSVRFEIKTARAAPTRPALDCFRDLEDRVEEAPVRAPVARPKPTAPVEVVEPPVIDCAGCELRRNHIDARLELRLLRHRHAIAATSYRENRQRRRRQRLGRRRGPGRGAPPPRHDLAVRALHRRVTRRQF